MRISKTRIVLFVSLTILVAFFASSIRPTQSGNENSFSLHPPKFVSTASAAATSALSAIEEEAGISAYYKADSSIDLGQIRNMYRTIEDETSTYIIGSMAVGTYPESEDVHVYVDVNGWILAYYLDGVPTGKIVDWTTYHNSGQATLTTKLETTVSAVAGQAGVPYSGATHYHFQFPNATHIAIALEHTTTYGVFDINIPSEWGYLERSWSAGGDHHLDLWVNSERVLDANYSGWNTYEGLLTAAQLPPDQFHTIGVDEIGGGGQDVYGSIVLLYRIP